jgi:hypothetical protein
MIKFCNSPKATVLVPLNYPNIMMLLLQLILPPCHIFIVSSCKISTYKLWLQTNTWLLNQDINVLLYVILSHINCTKDFRTRNMPQPICSCSIVGVLISGSEFEESYGWEPPLLRELHEKIPWQNVIRNKKLYAGGDIYDNFVINFVTLCNTMLFFYLLLVYLRHCQ